MKTDTPSNLFGPLTAADVEDARRLVTELSAQMLLLRQHIYVLEELLHLLLYKAPNTLATHSLRGRLVLMKESLQIAIDSAQDTLTTRNEDE